MEILRKIYYFLLDIAQTLILAAAAFVIVYMFLFRPFEVSGESMFPNLHDSEYLITNVIGQRIGDPHVGDIIVFKSPSEPDKDFIKRIIGVEGNSISIENGKVLVNGDVLDESIYLDEKVKTYGGSFLTEGDEVVVPEGFFFVLGDNRSYSSDSREWGFVPKDNIVGSSIFIYWPLNNAGFIENPYLGG